jgi:hypothetical protein
MGVFQKVNEIAREAATARDSTVKEIDEEEATVRNGIDRKKYTDKEDRAALEIYDLACAQTLAAINSKRPSANKVPEDENLAVTHAGELMQTIRTFKSLALNGWKGLATKQLKCFDREDDRDLALQLLKLCGVTATERGKNPLNLAVENEAWRMLQNQERQGPEEDMRSLGWTQPRGGRGW